MYEMTEKFPRLAVLIRDALESHSGSEIAATELEEVLDGLANNSWAEMVAMESSERS